MASPTARRVVLLALCSRLLVLAAMLAAGGAFLDLDTSTRLQVQPCDRQAANAPKGSGGGNSGGALAGGLAVWDAVHFVRIAKCGYETDMLAAFFPLLPATMRLWHNLAGLSPGAAASVASEGALLVLGGLATSLAAFCVAALFLHKLSLRTLKDRPLADLSLLLFCLNPASVFYSAPYTEALYAAASFLGLWLLPTHHWEAVGALVAASAARSNGMLNSWFVVHKLLRAWRLQGRLYTREVVTTVLSCLLLLAPYAAMQGYGYWTFCLSPHQDPPSWCSAAIPSLYSHIQKQYWGVGLLQFYRDPARVPMIAAALPVGYLSIRGCYQYFAADPLRALSLGLYSSRDPSLPPPLAWLAARLPWAPAAAPRLGFFGPEVAPFIYHWALLTAVALLVMNVHVATRFLSVCPPLYWYTAHYISSGRRRRALWVWGWIWVYIVLGCLLFPNYYPWT